MRSFFVIFFILSSINTWAQNRCFKAYAVPTEEVTTFCINQQITFQDCGNQIPDENEYYVFDYKSGTPIPTPSSPEKTHTYTKPGKYRVLQIANYGGSTLTDTVSQVFEVKAAPLPAFTVLPCAGKKVSITITDTTYDNYSIDFGNGQQQQVNKGAQVTHTYTQGGTATIILTGSYSGASCQTTTDTTISLLPDYTTPLLKKVEVIKQQPSGNLTLTLENLQPGFDYTIERWQDPKVNFRTIDTIQNVTQTSLTYTLNSVNTAEGVWYRVRPRDKCSPPPAIESNMASNIVLTATPADEQVLLRWEAIADQIQQFELYRNGNLVQTFAPTFVSYTDTELKCGQSYTYGLVAKYSNGVTSTSALQQVTINSTTTPAAGQLFSSFNLENNVVLSLEVPQDQTVQTVQFERSIAGATFKLLTSDTQPNYTDTSIAPKQVCYRATYTNACGNTATFSNRSCPVILQVDQNDASISLQWSDFTGFKSGEGIYVVEVLDENNTVLSTYPTAGNTYTDHNLPDTQLFKYRIKVTSADGTAVSYSNTKTIEQPLKLFVPSAFTPNNDGLNDVLEVKGKFFSNYSITIYNRLGKVVYQSDNTTSGWDGTFKGIPAPSDVYTYKITVTTSEGESKYKTGTVTLLR